MLRRRYQLLSKIEDVEGTAVALAAADADLVLGHVPNPDRQIVDRDAAQESLDREPDNPGSGSLAFPFGLDLRGSGSLGTKPRFGKFLRACAMREAPIASLTVGAITGGPYKHGEHVVGGTSGARGIVIEDTAATPLRVGVVHGAFQSGETITGQTSAATSTSSGVTATQGWLYISDSLQASSIATTGAWTGTGQLGEVLVGQTSGACGVLRGGPLTGTPGSLYLEMVPGTPAFVGGETALGQNSGATIGINATPAIVTAWTPSLTMESRCDGFFFRGGGARGNAVFQLTAGQPTRIDFSYLAARLLHGDAPILAGASNPTAPVLRFAAAEFKLDNMAFPTGSLSIDLGNAVSLDPDPNATDGMRSALIGDKNPVVTLDPRMVLKGAYDYFGKIDGAVTAKIRWSMGTAGGSRVTGLLPAVQFAAGSFGDREGIKTLALQGRPKKTAGSAGDNAIAIWMD